MPKGVAVRIRARAYPSSTSCHCSSAVEHPIRNRAVVGSSPTSGSTAPTTSEFLSPVPMAVSGGAQALGDLSQAIVPHFQIFKHPSRVGVANPVEGKLGVAG